MLKSFYIFVILIFINSCNNTASSISQTNPEFDILNLDVVEKKLNIQSPIDQFTKNLLIKWFENKIKLIGFNGIAVIDIFDYSELITVIDNGKKVDISFKFNVSINNSSISHSNKKTFQGHVSSFDSIIGDFSLNDFDNVIQNTRIKVIRKFTEDLKSKI